MLKELPYEETCGTQSLSVPSRDVPALLGIPGSPQEDDLDCPSFQNLKFKLWLLV